MIRLPFGLRVDLTKSLMASAPRKRKSCVFYAGVSLSLVENPLRLDQSSRVDRFVDVNVRLARRDALASHACP